jgi:hypothetical protein
MVDTKSVYTLSEPKTGGQQVKDAFISLIVVAIIYFLFVLPRLLPHPSGSCSCRIGRGLRHV